MFANLPGNLMPENGETREKKSEEESCVALAVKGTAGSRISADRGGGSKERRLVIFFWLMAPETFALWVASLAEALDLRGSDVVLRYRRVIGESGQLDAEADGADAGSVLIAGAVREECFVGDIQCEFAFVLRGAHVERVFAHQRLRCESQILDNNAAGHLAPVPSKF